MSTHNVDGHCTHCGAQAVKASMQPHRYLVWSSQTPHAVAYKCLLCRSTLTYERIGMRSSWRLTRPRSPADSVRRDNFLRKLSRQLNAGPKNKGNDKSRDPSAAS